MNDTVMRLIGIPVFGILIPHLSGLYDGLSLSNPIYWLGYPYFIGLSAAIWQGNRYLMFRTRQRFTWFDRPIEKLILLVINNIFYTSPLTVAWLCIWYQIGGYPHADWAVILITTLINVICVLFVIHVYETVFMMKEQQNEQLINERLITAKTQAELEALKNQIDPHFMFNSLNSLSYLIMSEPKKAMLFTEHLADIYRYILSQKDRTLVVLEDEMNFVKKYVDLLELRFGNALHIRRNYHISRESEFLIPPISIFIAMENVVKHNEINLQSPLQVDLKMNGSTLYIVNRIQPKKTLQHSSGIGLKNLDERFSIITGKGIKTGKSNGHFSVHLPLMAISTPQQATHENHYH
jgi:hypothetical protein